jgi:uncharacterized cupin superfamily protein
MTDVAKSVRRIVTIDNARGTSEAIADGPAPDIRNDPARPGFESTRIWATSSSPVKIGKFRDTVDLPHALEPPPRGSVCRIVTIPPDASWRRKVGKSEVAAFFRAMGSPHASTYAPSAPHSYMQKTRSLDFCLILDGEVTLVLDTEEAHLTAGDTVVQRGTNHAWSNRSDQPCRIAISSHDAKE